MTDSFKDYVTTGIGKDVETIAISAVVRKSLTTVPLKGILYSVDYKYIDDYLIPHKAKAKRDLLHGMMDYVTIETKREGEDVKLMAKLNLPYIYDIAMKTKDYEIELKTLRLARSELVLAGAKQRIELYQKNIIDLELKIGWYQRPWWNKLALKAGDFLTRW